MTKFIFAPNFVVGDLLGPLSALFADTHRSQIHGAEVFQYAPCMSIWMPLCILKKKNKKNHQKTLNKKHSKNADISKYLTFDMCSCPYLITWALRLSNIPFYNCEIQLSLKRIRCKRKAQSQSEQSNPISKRVARGSKASAKRKSRVSKATENTSAKQIAQRNYWEQMRSPRERLDQVALQGEPKEARSVLQS